MFCPNSGNNLIPKLKFQDTFYEKKTQTHKTQMSKKKGGKGKKEIKKDTNQYQD